jgi:hypothetical protein
VSNTAKTRPRGEVKLGGASSIYNNNSRITITMGTRIKIGIRVTIETRITE